MSNAVPRMLNAICSLVVVSVAFGVGVHAVANQEQPQPRMLHVVDGVAIAKQLNPDDRLVIVYRIGSAPEFGKPLTLQQDLERLETWADAIALIDVQEVKGVPTAAGDWATTQVRGKIVDRVRSSERAPLGEPDGMVTFEFDGGELSIGNAVAKVGTYPLLKAGERYLVMFQLHPSGLRWNPFQPFRVDSSGRLERVQFFSVYPIEYTSPLEGQLLSTIAAALRKK